MNIELTSFLDNEQNVWFKGKDIATALGYSDTTQATRKKCMHRRQIQRGRLHDGGFSNLSFHK